MREEIKAQYDYQWTVAKLQYLGVQIPINLSTMLQINFKSFIDSRQYKLKSWNKPFLTWPDRVHIIQSFFFPFFFFLPFQKIGNSDAHL